MPSFSTNAGWDGSVPTAFFPRFRHFQSYATTDGVQDPLQERGIQERRRPSPEEDGADAAAGVWRQALIDLADQDVDVLFLKIEILEAARKHVRRP